MPASSDDWTLALPHADDGPSVWRVDLGLDETRRRACIDMLCDEERARADRFVHAEDRDRFIASHAALRVIVAGALGTAPGDLVFARTKAGKPELAAAWRGRLHFNLSHSGGWALVGVSRTCRIGVDVELARPVPDHLQIARSNFAPSEVAALERLPPRASADAFLACWTQKEAFVKALGLGLSMALNRFTVAIPPEPAALVAIDGDAEPARLWSLRHLDPAPAHVGAVAFEAAWGGCALLSLMPG